MQNQPSPYYRINYEKIDVPIDFPITDLYYEKHTPSTDDVGCMHFHNHLELGYCYEGCGVFFVNGKVLPFSAGDASIIFPKEIHIAQSDRKKPSKWQFITIDILSLLSDLNITDLNLISSIIKGNNSFINIINKNDKSRITELVFDIFTELEKHEYCYKSMIKSLVWSLIVKLKRVFGLHNINNTIEYNNKIYKIAPALCYISKNYMEQIRQNKLALICNVSITHFRRLFTIAMNIAPSKYIFIVRIKMAAILLLNTDDSVLQISLKVGYNTLSSFNRHFKKILNVSPREWKKGIK